MYSDSDVESDVSSEADDHTRRRAAYRKSQASGSQHETYREFGFCIDGYFLCEFYTLHLTRNSCSES